MQSGDPPTTDEEILRDRSEAIERYGVVAVIIRDQHCLLIRRSQTVAAPGAWCFPGGGIETGESEPLALRRELLEELGIAIEPGRRLWESVTDWRVHLAWWTATLSEDAVLAPNPAEVAEVRWLGWDEMAALDGLLSSNLAFLRALSAGEFSLRASDA